jgi:hypothetical protein
MIVSIHLAEFGGPLGTLGALRERPDPAATPGLRYAETTITAGLGGSALPVPQPGRAGLIAAWDDDEALDRYLADGRGAARFAASWHVRALPLRVSGAWPEMPGLPEAELPVDAEEPVAVLTLGWLRLTRVVRFLRVGAPAEAEVAEEPAVLVASGLARPPHLVSTFSVWSSAAAMREYAHRERGAHRAAIGADRERPFHHRSAFIRLRPYLSRGTWEGRDPLRGLLRPAPA